MGWEGFPLAELLTLAAQLTGLFVSFSANHHLLNLWLQAGIDLLFLDPLMSVPIDGTRIFTVIKLIPNFKENWKKEKVYAGKRAGGQITKCRCPATVKYYILQQNDTRFRGTWKKKSAAVDMQNSQDSYKYLKGISHTWKMCFQVLCRPSQALQHWCAFSCSPKVISVTLRYRNIVIFLWKFCFWAQLCAKADPCSEWLCVTGSGEDTGP